MKGFPNASVILQYDTLRKIYEAFHRIKINNLPGAISAPLRPNLKHVAAQNANIWPSTFLKTLRAHDEISLLKFRAFLLLQATFR